MSWGYYYPEYVSVAQKKANAQKKLVKLRKDKKYRDIEPIVIEGQSIAKTWWGKAWCSNLEKYSDYENRIGRGRSYVRHGFVFDLKIFSGKVTSLVQGSESMPYRCDIKFELLNSKNWDSIKDLTGSRFDSIEELLHGRFPKSLQEVFSDKGKGIFPASKEICFDCSCPDSANMCKHIAATLYAVGARFDNKPELLFTLRGVDLNELIGSTINSHKESVLSKAANAKSSRIINIKNDPLSKLFDIDFKS